MIPGTIRTARLTQRPFRPDDRDPMVAALAAWEIVRWMSPIPWPYAPADAEWFIAAASPGGSLHAAGEMTWALDDGAFAGVVGLGADLGYWLARDRWGRGLATEAVGAVLDAHFAQADAGAVRANYFDGNAASAKVLRKLGFVTEGPIRLASRALGREMPAWAMRRDPAV